VISSLRRVAFVRVLILLLLFSIFLNDPAATEIYPLSLHDALPICRLPKLVFSAGDGPNRKLPPLIVVSKPGSAPIAILGFFFIIQVKGIFEIGGIYVELSLIGNLIAKLVLMRHCAVQGLLGDRSVLCGRSRPGLFGVLGKLLSCQWPRQLIVQIRIKDLCGYGLFWRREEGACHLE